MIRHWLGAIGLVVWQVSSMAFSLTEFIYGHPAPLAGIVAAALTALGWLVFAADAGYHRQDAFGVFAAAVWLCIVLVLLASIFTAHLEGDDSVAPWHGALLLLLIVAAAPLYGLSSLLPIEPLVAGAVVAVGVLSVIIIVFLVARSVGSRLSATGLADAPSGRTSGGGPS